MTQLADYAIFWFFSKFFIEGFSIVILMVLTVKIEIGEILEMAPKIYIIFQHFLFADEWYRFYDQTLKQFILFNEAKC